MPITKERLLAVADAAHFYWQALKQIRHETKIAADRIKFYEENGPDSTDISSLAQNYTQLLIDLKTVIYFVSEYDRSPAHHLEAVIREQISFKQHFRQNEQSKRYNALRRIIKKQREVGELEYLVLEEEKITSDQNQNNQNQDQNGILTETLTSQNPIPNKIHSTVKNYMRLAWYDDAIKAMEKGELEPDDPDHLDRLKREREELRGS